MRRALGLAGLVALVLLVRSTMPAPDSAGEAALALGFVLVVSFFAGLLARAAGLPAITGYLLAGIVSGPHGLGWVHPVLAVLGPEPVSALQLLDAVALGLIAFSAGGGLQWATVRRYRHTLAWIVGLQVGLAVAGVTLGALAVRGAFPLLGALSPAAGLAAAVLLGVTASANSPASIVAIIQECRSRGPVTDIVLAVTVVKDVVVISLFTVALSLAVLLIRPGAAADAMAFAMLGWEVAGSVAVGLAMGWVGVQYMRRVGHELPLLVPGVAFVAVTVLPELHLSGLLACMVAGFYIENFSPHGDALLGAVERHALPVYVIFFTIAGANLDLPALARTWSLALWLAGLRMGLTALGTWAGAALTAAPATVRRGAWSGFVAQAGVTLGFAVLVGERFPEIGPPVQTLVLAGVAVNQIVGPVLFRYVLHASGEARPETAKRTA